MPLGTDAARSERLSMDRTGADVFTRTQSLQPVPSPPRSVPPASWIICAPAVSSESGAWWCVQAVEGAVEEAEPAPPVRRAFAGDTDAPGPDSLHFRAGVMPCSSCCSLPRSHAWL